MAITKAQQEAAINQILMDEVKAALTRRRASPIHLSRSQLFEEAAGGMLEAARAKVEEATFLLGEAKEMLDGDPQLAQHANAAFDASYTLMGEIDNQREMGDQEEEIPSMDTAGYEDVGDDDVELPPMHPRGRG